MKKKSFADVNALVLKRTKEPHPTDIKSSLTFLTFWPHINEEYFSIFYTKNFYKKDQLIHHAARYGNHNPFYSFIVPRGQNSKMKKFQSESKEQTFMPFDEFSKSKNSFLN